MCGEHDGYIQASLQTQLNGSLIRKPSLEHSLIGKVTLVHALVLPAQRALTPLVIWSAIRVSLSLREMPDVAKLDRESLLPTCFPLTCIPYSHKVVPELQFTEPLH